MATAWPSAAPWDSRGISDRSARPDFTPGPVRAGCSPMRFDARSARQLSRARRILLELRKEIQSFYRGRGLRLPARWPNLPQEH